MSETTVVTLRHSGGPKPKEYRIWLASLLRNKKHQEAFQRAMMQDEHPHFMAATKHAASYAIGLPVQPTIDITPKDPTSLAADALLQAIPRMLTVLNVSIQEKAKLLQAVEVDAEIVS